MASSSNQRKGTRRRMSSRTFIYEKWKKDDAHMAAKEAASMTCKLLLDMNSSTNGQKPGAASHDSEDRSIDRSSDMSVDSFVSYNSTEIAINRGTNRGSGEMNERSHSGVVNLDLAAISEEHAMHENQEEHPISRETTGLNHHRKQDKLSTSSTTSSESRRRRKKRGWFKKTNLEQTEIEDICEQISRDAWMCGCCGRAFSSLEAAEAHEDLCIREIIYRLEWADANQKGLAPSILPCIASPSTVLTRCGSNAGTMTSWDSSPNSFVFGRSIRQSFAAVLDSNRTREEHFDVVYNQDSQNIGDGKRFSKDLRQNSNGKMQYQSPVNIDNRPQNDSSEDPLLLTNAMRQYIVLTDEALVNTLYRAEDVVLTKDEKDAERELELLARDKSFYDMMNDRTVERYAHNKSRFHTNRKGVLSKVQNKFADAYDIIKEGDSKGSFPDEYSRKSKGNNNTTRDITHDDTTLYVNVVVKNSIQVVQNELERLAKSRWEATHSQNDTNRDNSIGAGHFEQFKKLTQARVVKLAGIALAGDFTPRRIAVQLSNDLYRLMAPRMKRRGVTIETEIEYRVGPFFILGVNVQKIDWMKLIKYTHREVEIRRRKWKRERARLEHESNSDSNMTRGEDKPEKESVLKTTLSGLRSLIQLTRFEIIAECLAWLYYVHWSIAVPLCTLINFFFLRSTMRIYLLTSVTDEIFYYVEEKGMEMQISVEMARNQAAFMLSVLREIRADGRSLKKQQEETKGGAEDQGVILGPLLGPAIPEDKLPASPPPGFEPPSNLEHVGLEIDLPVGFRRIRWAMLNQKSSFMRDAVWAEEQKYENINSGEWSHHNDEIGLPKLPDGIHGADFVGAELESDYLMPKSAFVKANTAYEIAMITIYNDHCFVLKKKTRTPEVPYGSTFIAWTQYVFTNTGNNSCRMVCSTEAEFPNGPPMISGQIKGGMRAGTALLFVNIGETICKYAEEYPK